MFIKAIKLFNFRQFEQLEVFFSPSINVVTGMNAVGKTSLLESIGYLGVTKSFREASELDLIRDGQSELAVLGTIFTQNQEKKLRVLKQKQGKSVFSNNFRYKKISEYLGELLVVSYCNADLMMLVGGAADRRKIFEPIICQISPFYVSVYNSYKKVLSERNALLKRLIFENNNKLLEVLKVIDERLDDYGKKVIEERKKFIDNLNVFLGSIHNKISSTFETIKIEYLPSVKDGEIMKNLEKNFNEDLKKGYTNYGPHKDDYIFIINNKNIIHYGSLGQQKNMLITIKLAFVELIKSVKGDYPILLLDDVLSELDGIRQNNLLKAINSSVQAIISSATLSEINPDLLSKAKIITLEKRSV
ncbi:MAG: DNA replication/repair protein RecF [Anaeroplasma bactoclasticum]|nr:DNA replication/repair protein RecF [Anaeroplasma bactoclasticum]